MNKRMGWMAMGGHNHPIFRLLIAFRNPRASFISRINEKAPLETNYSTRAYAAPRLAKWTGIINDIFTC